MDCPVESGMRKKKHAMLLIAIVIFSGMMTQAESRHSRTDTDCDGVADSVDNCPDYWNPEQYDADEDGIGNVCDECTDQDGDGYGDPGFPLNTCPVDNCPGFYNPDQSDLDFDGIGDSCEGLECGDVSGNGDFFMEDWVLLANYLWRGGKSPASMPVANTGGCVGVNVHDIAYTFGSTEWWWTDCDGPVDCPPVLDGAVSLDHVDGQLAVGVLATEQSIRFYIRLSGGDSVAYRGLANGFRIYSPTGLEWGCTAVSELVDFSEGWPYMFLNVISTCLLGVTGSGADTIALGYMEMQLGTGLLPSFDSVTHAIDIGPIPDEFEGGEICLDSCWYPPGGDWMWSTVYPDGYPTLPAWDGPHCFTVLNCCQIRGDIDANLAGPDIADLIYMVTYMFQEGPDLPCPETADINGDELPEPDIADLIYLVTFMFQDGPPPADCPQ